MLQEQLEDHMKVRSTSEGSARFSIRELLRNFGPAWLVMIADVDIASIVTGLQAGSVWGYRMIFVMVLLIVPLFFIQDAAGRLGIASGYGLGAATRRYFGRKVAIAAAILWASVISSSTLPSTQG